MEIGHYRVAIGFYWVVQFLLILMHLLKSLHSHIHCVQLAVRTNLPQVLRHMITRLKQQGLLVLWLLLLCCARCKDRKNAHKWLMLQRMHQSNLVLSVS